MGSEGAEVTTAAALRWWELKGVARGTPPPAPARPTPHPTPHPNPEETDGRRCAKQYRSSQLNPLPEIR
jgi:hypothetical protein